MEKNEDKTKQRVIILIILCIMALIVLHILLLRVYGICLFKNCACTNEQNKNNMNNVIENNNNIVIDNNVIIDNNEVNQNTVQPENEVEKDSLTNNMTNNTSDSSKNSITNTSINNNSNSQINNNSGSQINNTSNSSVNNTSDSSLNNTSNSSVNNNQTETVQEPEELIISSEDFKWGQKSKIKVFEDVDIMGDGNIYLYPGKEGKYDFKINNNTNYRVKYDLTFEESEQKEINIKYKLKKNNQYVVNSWSDANILNIVENKLDSKANDVYTLEWKWVEETTDKDLSSAGKNYSLNIVVNTVQE